MIVSSAAFGVDTYVHNHIVMTPVDKASEKEKETAEREEDLRHEWIEEDIQSQKRKPNLEELEEDSEIL